jgi:hypothetical protein
LADESLFKGSPRGVAALRFRSCLARGAG